MGDAVSSAPYPPVHPYQDFACGCRGVWVLTTAGPTLCNLNLKLCALHLPGRRAAPEPADPDVEKLENKILDILGEFGDQPADCLSIISELIEQRQHFRAHPNAPRVE